MKNTNSQFALDNKYNSFIGKTVLPVKDEYGLEVPDMSDNVVPTLLSYAAAEGKFIRWWFPKTIGTMDLRTDRINVHVNRNNIITTISVG